MKLPTSTHYYIYDYGKSLSIKSDRVSDHKDYRLHIVPIDNINIDNIVSKDVIVTMGTIEEL